MPQTCTVCSHSEAFEVNERLIVEKQSNRRIATQFGLKEAAIRRHREHIPELLIKASLSEEIASADDLLAEVQELHARTLSVLDAAEEAEELRTALSAIREARGNLELLARLRQLIDQQPQVTSNIIISPEAVDAIVAALLPYGAARRAVIGALDELERLELEAGSS
jgi:hypothetical protein